MVRFSCERRADTVFLVAKRHRTLKRGTWAVAGGDCGPPGFLISAIHAIIYYHKAGSAKPAVPRAQRACAAITADSELLLARTGLTISR